MGVGVVITSPNGIDLEKSLRLSFSATNNEAEYEALWSELAAIKDLGGNHIEVFSGSQLIVGQVLGEYEAKDARMQAYLGKIKQLQAHFRELTLKQVPRCKNSNVDSLATLVTMFGGALP